MQTGMIYIKKGKLITDRGIIFLTFNYEENGINPSLIQTGSAIQFEDRMYMIDNIIPSNIQNTFKLKIHIF